MTDAHVPVGAPTAPSSGAGGGWLAWVGGVIAVGLAAMSALWEAFLTPLAWTWTSGGHAHYVRMPVALVLAVVGNAALAWFTRAVTGKVLAILAPFAVYTAVMLVAAGKTHEGDLVLAANNWVAVATLIVGPTSFAVAAYWLVIRSIRRPG
ncbi:hypothetical protein HC031_07385 [Planosporangium thailandense]|uniref:Uncharacterized protein n=1 Tax=Planosporangium thailandense TaxID=765197 RepID=A0ABX0XWJ5_9ACTN|nr:hypothetical protein [Planosporangium thailandense]NJC69544.1 hypothetical protein [Planosporangium thailandense]